MAMRAIHIEVRSHALLDTGRRITRRRQPIEFGQRFVVGRDVEEPEMIPSGQLLGGSSSGIAERALNLPGLQPERVAGAGGVAFDAFLRTRQTPLLTARPSGF